jgi:hypothetical protein
MVIIVNHFHFNFGYERCLLGSTSGTLPPTPTLPSRHISCRTPHCLCIPLRYTASGDGRGILEYWAATYNIITQARRGGDIDTSIIWETRVPSARGFPTAKSTSIAMSNTLLAPNRANLCMTTCCCFTIIHRELSRILPYCRVISPAWGWVSMGMRADLPTGPPPAGSSTTNFFLVKG